MHQDKCSSCIARHEGSLHVSKAVIRPFCCFLSMIPHDCESFTFGSGYRGAGMVHVFKWPARSKDHLHVSMYIYNMVLLSHLHHGLSSIICTTAI
jgi:hypothetical protein